MTTIGEYCPDCKGNAFKCVRCEGVTCFCSLCEEEVVNEYR
jgi:hypothetical protein